MRTVLALAVAAVALGGACGCISVKAPERIEIGGSDRPAPVDSNRVPPTATHEEARAELEKAYANLRYMEQENARLERKAAEYKRERDEARKRLERYEND